MGSAQVQWGTGPGKAKCTIEGFRMAGCILKSRSRNQGMRQCWGLGAQEQIGDRGNADIVWYVSGLCQLQVRADSLEKTLMLGKIEGGKRRGCRELDGWMASRTQWT